MQAFEIRPSAGFPLREPNHLHVSESAPARRMLFVRTYHSMLGGHLKVFDYLRHVAASGIYEPVLWLTAESAALPPAELLPPGCRIVREPIAADAYFTAGMNWRIFDEAGIEMGDAPVVSLIQSMRHATPGDPRRAELGRRALRVCVSERVARALRATNGVNGPIVAIPNGIDVSGLASLRGERAERVFIGGAKDAPRAEAIARHLRERGVETDLETVLIPREAFLRRIAASRVAVLLPHAYEGFYLPALEAMALGTAVVLPPCEGTADFCIDDRTCVVATEDGAALAKAAAALLRDRARTDRLAHEASLVAARHSLERECSLFSEALNAYVRDRA